jgi:alkanesulfonate monooxygenase SsuD/methylene tetrahydromethanopterin reductase-like flavin-dependent oxidoreductase (luciferase family)
MEFGIYTFGELTPHWQTGRALTPRQRMEDIVAAAKLADRAGFDVFALGEHHRLDFAIASTAVALAAIARETRRIRLASAVTILTTADPVRTYEDFATLDLMSGGRAEIIAGRGIYTESFPLFGFDVKDSDALYDEHLALLLTLTKHERVTWSGRFRPPLDNAAIPPRTEAPLPVWVGTGGTPDSVVRAGRLGLPLMLANISVPPAKFAPLIAQYRETARQAGHTTGIKVGVAKHLHVQKDSQAARDTFYPYYAGYFRSHHPAHFKPREVSRAEYDQLASPQGALFVGSPQEIIDKILYEHSLFGHERFIVQVDIGAMPLSGVERVIDLLASDVIPAVNKALG